MIYRKKYESQADVKIKIMTKISLVKGDITKQKVDAIVNTANKTLLGGG